MREIKFRAYDRRDGKMHEVFGVTRISVCYEESAKTPVHYELLTDEIVLMQYTGLKDRNGADVYEGDICKYTDDDHWSDKLGDDYVAAVVWDGEDACFYLGGLSPRYQKHAEVIGNVYENPELLPDGK